MAGVDRLVQRIRDEFSASEASIKQFQQQQTDLHQAREKREEQLEQLFGQLTDVWRPRLEALAKEFGDRLQVQPAVNRGRRQATFEVKSPVASIKLGFTASGNTDVTELVLTYDLDILPILMEFERHAEISYPLDQVDPDQVAQWFDDRIVGFVKTYLALHSNQYYLKDLMVEDPVAHVSFPKFAAGATRERGGKTLYFVSESTAAEFDAQNKS
ncbi:MAG: hypothetical protein KF708_19860 [Pirellulales bacterium]|nr:hypothetical protein [Pirellulales bacterium]